MPTNAFALTRMLIAERPLLVRLAQRIVGDVHTAEDIAQSLWFRVQRIEDDPPILNKRAYLFRLATNLATDHARADKRQRALFDSDGLPEDVADDQPSVEKALADRAQFNAFMTALDELPPRTRRVVVMRKFNNRPINEIAEELGLSRSSIAKMLQAALLHCDEKMNRSTE